MYRNERTLPRGGTIEVKNDLLLNLCITTNSFLLFDFFVDFFLHLYLPLPLASTLIRKWDLSSCLSHYFSKRSLCPCTWAQPLIAAFEPSLSFISLSCPRILCFTPMMATSYQEHVISRTSCKGFPTIGRIWGPISPAHFPSSFLVRDSEIRLNSCICLIS